MTPKQTKHLRDEVVPLSKLKPHPKNPRKHSPDYIKRIERSINAFDKTNPIIVTPDYTIVAGHARLIAAQQLGLTDFPIRIFDFTNEEAEAYMIADNKLAEGSEWIDSILVDLFSDLEFKQFDLELTGYDTSEICSLRDSVSEEVGEDNFDVDTALSEGECRAKRGEVYSLGRHRLMCGDATDDDDVAKLMKGIKADMVFTDPPYGVSYKGGVMSERERLIGDDTSELYKPCCEMAMKYSADDAPLYLWYAAIKGIAATSAIAAIAAIAAGYEIRCELIWNKNQAQYGALSAQYKQKHEPCYYCFKQGKGARWNGPTTETTVWEVDRASKNEYHPTQKPIALAARAIKNHNVKTVLDLFGGSGSTLIACEQTGRTCYMMEIDPHYCDVILKRWEDYTGNHAEVIPRQQADLQN